MDNVQHCTGVSAFKESCQVKYDQKFFLFLIKAYFVFKIGKGTVMPLPKMHHLQYHLKHWPSFSSLPALNCLWNVNFTTKAGQRQNPTLSSATTQVNLPSRNEVFLPWSPNSWDFWSSHFSYNLQKNQVINVFLKMWLSSNTSHPPEWKGPNPCSHVRTHQLFFDLNIG